MNDTPTHRQSIDEIPVEQFEKHLEHVREARLIAKKMHESSILLANEVRETQLRKKFDKNIIMYNKELLQLDKLIDKLDKRINTLRAISLEAGVFVEPINMKELSIKGVDGNAIKKSTDSERLYY